MLSGLPEILVNIAHAQTVDTRPFFPPTRPCLGTRLGYLKRAPRTIISRTAFRALIHISQSVACLVGVTPLHYLIALK